MDHAGQNSTMIWIFEIDLNFYLKMVIFNSKMVSFGNEIFNVIEKLICRLVKFIMQEMICAIVDF